MARVAPRISFVDEPERNLVVPEAVGDQIVELLGGLRVTKDQISQALAALKEHGGGSLRRQLKTISSPLASLDAREILRRYQAEHPDPYPPDTLRRPWAASVKAAMIWYLAAQLVPAPRQSAETDDGFKVLLDDPAAEPGLDFDRYASALAGMIARSKAEFAVGIFGGWGTGKTTLMRAISRRLQDDGIVRVWFSAWRYEREPHLIVPLLDVLREELEVQAKQPGKAAWAGKAARAVAGAGQAFLAGARIKAGLPGVELEVDFGAVKDALDKDAQKRAAANARPVLSTYHLGFVRLKAAISELAAGGRRRVVIFVDDLDRCLPERALEVLESMKLFFDVEGCVFVVGLDQDIVERAVLTKYQRGQKADAEPDPALTPVSGGEYIKKIFQVPFFMPRLADDQLFDYLTTLQRTSGFGLAQLQDFRDTVRPHLLHLRGSGQLNPREVKRLINTYTLQLQILDADPGRPGQQPPDRHVVLALLCMNFRKDWQMLYEQLVTDPELFQNTLAGLVHRGTWPEDEWIGGARVRLPVSFIDYLDGIASPLLAVPNLAAYVAAADSSLSTEPWVLKARIEVGRLSKLVDGAAGRAIVIDSHQLEEAPLNVDALVDDIENLAGLISPRRRADGIAGEISSRVESAYLRLRDQAQSMKLTSDALSFGSQMRKLAQLLGELDEVLREYSRSVSVY